MQKLGYGFPGYWQNKFNRRAFQPKTFITNQISEQEKLEAEEALKMKMANKGKKRIRQTNRANQFRRSPNYNNLNITWNNNMNQRKNLNNMNYNYPANITEF